MKINVCGNLPLAAHLAATDSACKKVSETVRALNLMESAGTFRARLAFYAKPKASNLSSERIYSILLEKCIPHLFSPNKEDVSFGFLQSIDPSAKDAFVLLKSQGIAIRCLLKNKQGEQERRIFLLMQDSSAATGKIACYFFGNVDLFVSSKHASFPYQLTCTDKSLYPKIWLEVCRFLDGGQRLNLSEAPMKMDHLFCHNLKQDAFAQHYRQLMHYAETFPNGPLLISPLRDPFFVVHQTPYKKPILASGELRLSRGGCIGNLVYTTELLGDNGLALGGHAIGLLERKRVCLDDFEKNLLLLKVDKRANVFSNWIDKLGRGHLVLSSREHLLEIEGRVDFREVDDDCGIKSLKQYQKIYPLLQLAKLFCSASVHGSSLPFDETSGFFIQCDRLRREISPLDSSTLMNGIFFEIIKDFILLFQDDAVSRQFRELHSFNMGLQYDIFFQLCPELRANWDTTKFCPTFDEIKHVLSQMGFLQNSSQIEAFTSFVMERFSYYINVGVLEGAEVLPDPLSLTHFEDLCNVLPNLAGLLYHNSCKTSLKKTPFYENFCAQVRVEYQKFYRQRMIVIAIKCGLARTEEIGLSQYCPVSFYDFAIEHQGRYQVQITPTAGINGMSIAGVSTTNGFTQRCS